MGLVDAERFLPGEFSIDCARHPRGWPILVIKGRVVGTTASLLIEGVGRRLETVTGPLLVDLRACTFFSSIAVGLVVALAEVRRKQPQPARVVLVGARAQTLNIIDLLGFRRIFELCETFDEAERCLDALAGV